VVLLGALAVALSGAPPVPVALTAALGVLIALSVLAPRAIADVRQNRGLSALAALLLAMSVWVTVMLTRLSAWSPGPPVINGFPANRPTAPSLGGTLPLLVAILLTAAGGLVLIADAVRVWLGYAPHQRAPWKQMTESRQRSGGIAWRATTGVLLVGWAAFLGIGLAGRYVVGDPGLQVLVLLVVAAAAAVVITTPVAIGSLMRVDRDKVGSARERERQRFAAHLHDSVLQTLALVQRQAHDPVAVARLARRQEYALRAWMAGESELVSETLVAALRDVVASIEDEHGITVELTAIGDRPLDSAGEELVAAAREALRNAARHASGARIFVFAASTADGAEVFVRDEGPGFDPDAVPAERRGIRDAIVGRMAFAGGVATLESAPGEGTEVALRIGPGKASR
jgi:signal transduction histidine kinase